ncbi:MAG: hypothetical protein ACRC3Y_16350 [Romboutsia sp.]|uniref:hypothetical protein n=1 Tax=Romboutsia sp. TaxID=1965302 RepID=UPI003F3EE78A
MDKFQKLTKLSYVFIILSTLLFIGYISTSNIILGICALIFAYAGSFIYHYINYKFTGNIKWLSIISSIILGIIILFSIV